MEAASDVDFITVSAFAEDEVLASYADLAVSVRGNAFFTGSEALRKAREVAALAGELSALGIADADIALEDITADTTSGLLSKSSSATYTLRVRCRVIDKVGDVVGAISAQKNCTLNGITWGFDENEISHLARLSTCATQANARAQAVANALGVGIVGVHRLEEVVSPGEMVNGDGGAVTAAPGMRRRMGADDLGLTITHKKKLRLDVAVRYRVGPRR